MVKVKTSNKPEKLRPYLFHGVDLIYSDGSDQALGSCPFCGKQKFYVSIKTGKCQCKVCGVSGNTITFLSKMYESFGNARESGLKGLAEDRRLYSWETLRAWGVRRHNLLNKWVIPGYSVEGRLNQLYVYVQDGRKRLLLGTPTIPHKLFGMPLFDPKHNEVFVCEGPWDGMALWEMLRWTKLAKDGSLSLGGDSSKSLASAVSVLAVPGAGVFYEAWGRMLKGRVINLCYDNDIPYKHSRTGQAVPSAGLEGAKRTANLLASVGVPPKSINYLTWGGEGYSKGLPSGYDIRDCVGGTAVESRLRGLADRLEGLKHVVGYLAPIPQMWLKSSATASDSLTGGMDPLPCDSYRIVRRAWRKALKWTPGLDYALVAMLATITSTKSVGDQLWIKVIGPAACGKSTLCEAISVSRRYVIAKSTIRGFHSGYQTDQNGSEDNSLVAKVGGKTLVTKDGDTLLQSPNLGQILSEARDLYDTVSRTSYRNKSSRDYQGVRMTWILCGTSSLRSIDSSELGERFLDCVIMDSVDSDLEDEILWRVVNRAHKNVCIEADGRPETQQEPEMTAAMQLTGGFVEYLRENAIALLNDVEFPDGSRKKCMRMAKLVAYMRARPSKVQDEQGEREAAFRLASQLVRMSQCMAVVLGKDEVDEEVMGMSRQVALDTARGYTLVIAAHLFDEPMGVRRLSQHIDMTEPKVAELMRFLRQIGAVARFTEKKSNVTKYRLTKRLSGLYREVVCNEKVTIEEKVTTEETER